MGSLAFLVLPEVTVPQRLAPDNSLPFSQPPPQGHSGDLGTIQTQALFMVSGASKPSSLPGNQLCQKYNVLKKERTNEQKKTF